MRFDENSSAAQQMRKANGYFFHIDRRTTLYPCSVSAGQIHVLMPLSACVSLLESVCVSLSLFFFVYFRKTRFFSINTISDLQSNGSYILMLLLINKLLETEYMKLLKCIFCLLFSHLSVCFICCVAVINATTIPEVLLQISPNHQAIIILHSFQRMLYN